MRAFTAVRGGSFVEELTLEISNKLIRERDSWLLRLSLDFLNINEWCLSKNHSKSRHSFVIQFALTCLLLVNVSLASASIPGNQTGITGYIKPSLRPKKVPSHKVRTFKFCDECTAWKNREDSKGDFYNNCLNSRTLVDQFSTSIRVQTDKVSTVNLLANENFVDCYK